MISFQLVVMTSVILLFLEGGQCHKNQFRVLALQYTTLAQRLQLETTMLQEELAQAKDAVNQLKADNTRIISMFEVFTSEIQKLQTIIASERYKFESLEKDFKNLQVTISQIQADILGCCDNCRRAKSEDSVSGQNKIIDCNKASSERYASDSGETQHQGIAKLDDISNMREGIFNSSLRTDQYLVVCMYGESDVYFIDLKTGGLPSKSYPLPSKSALVVTTDESTRRMYWSDDENKSIFASDNGNDLTLVDSDIKCLGLAIDSKKRLVFYTNVTGSLFVKSVDHLSEPRKFLTDIGPRPRRIVVDPRHQHIYAITQLWTGIVRIDYKGKQYPLIQTRSRIKTIYLDKNTNMLYMGLNASVHALDLGGSDSRTFEIARCDSVPSDIVVHDGFLYVVYYFKTTMDVFNVSTKSLVKTIHLQWTTKGRTVSMSLY